MRLRRLEAADALRLAGFFLLCTTVPNAVSFIHETLGHRAACIAFGHPVTEWQPWFLLGAPHTACLPVTPAIAAAGSIASSIAWLGLSAGVYKLAPRLKGDLLALLAAVWFVWSFWVFGEFVMDAIHAYAPGAHPNDADMFVALTGVHPALASALMWGVTGAMTVPLFYVSRRVYRAFDAQNHRFAAILTSRKPTR
jgi:hypothetical protein